MTVGKALHCCGETCVCRLLVPSSHPSYDGSIASPVSEIPPVEMAVVGWFLLFSLFFWKKSCLRLTRSKLHAIYTKTRVRDLRPFSAIDLRCPPYGLSPSLPPTVAPLVKLPGNVVVLFRDGLCYCNGEIKRKGWHQIV